MTDNTNNEGWQTVGKKQTKKPNLIISSAKSFTTPVTTLKTNIPNVTHQAVHNAGKNVQNESDVDMRKIERGEIRLQTSSKELATKIQQYRMAKGWTQDDLNKKCSFKPNTIKSYENMTAIVTQSDINTLNRVLGVNDLKKPKAIKLNPES